VIYTTNYTLNTLDDDETHALPQVYDVDCDVKMKVKYDNLFNGNKFLGEILPINIYSLLITAHEKFSYIWFQFNKILGKILSIEQNVPYTTV
jgi:hypothetical protein